MTVALIDGDLLKFRCAASAENEPEAWIALARVDSMLEEILAATEASSYEIWLSGENNFRYAVYPEYKANRKPERPKWEKDCKDYLINVLGAQVAEGCEADDALGWRAYELGAEGKQYIIVTNDKDLKQICGWHYDPVKKVKFWQSDYDADRFFYYQCLVGDPVDNIKGVPGVGPVKANKILDKVTEDYENYEEAFPEEKNDREPLTVYWQDAVMQEYSCIEEFMMNARCLWIMREKGKMYGV